MDENKLIAQLGEAIAAPIGALQLAFAHLISRLAATGHLDRAAFAAELESCAKVMPQAALNQEAIARHLYTLAQQIRNLESAAGLGSLQ